MSTAGRNDGNARGGETSRAKPSDNHAYNHVYLRNNGNDISGAVRGVESPRRCAHQRLALASGTAACHASGGWRRGGTRGEERAPRRDTAGGQEGDGAMLTAYLAAALRQAEYEILPDDEGFFGRIAALPGVWGHAPTLEETREEVREALEGWVALALAGGVPIPAIDGVGLALVAAPCCPSTARSAGGA